MAGNCLNWLERTGNGNVNGHTDDYDNDHYEESYGVA